MWTLSTMFTYFYYSHSFWVASNKSAVRLFGEREKRYSKAINNNNSRDQFLMHKFTRYLPRPVTNGPEQFSWYSVRLKQPGVILTRVRAPGVAGDLFPSQLPVQTPVRCPHSPRVQRQASTSVRALKIPNTGSHTIVCTHGYTAHTDTSG